MYFISGISSCNLDYVISFIYNGEVSVAQDDLDSFLAAAEELQIKGLTQGKAIEPPKNKVKNIPQSTSPYRKFTSSKSSVFSEHQFFSSDKAEFARNSDFRFCFCRILVMQKSILLLQKEIQFFQN